MVRNFGWAVAAAASLAGIGAASAADMAVKARPLPPPIYSWTGCYIGLSAGGKGVGIDETVRTNAAGAIPATAADLGRREAETWIAGGQVGCNYQAGTWVFGVEGDVHGQKWQQSDVLTFPVGPVPIGTGSVFSLSSDWQASARGRIGYAMNRTLFYGTAGAAWTEVRSSVSWVPLFVAGPPILTNESRTLLGVTVGAGVEHAVTDNFTLGLEGRYTWYERQRFNAGVVPVGTTGVIAVSPVFGNAYRDVKIETGEIMVKANWKFGPGAVVARY